MDGPLYTASDWGNEFHSSTVDELLGAGAAGPGKTLVLLMDVVPQIISEHNRCLDPKHPNRQRWGDSTGWALSLRREFPTLEETIARSERIFPRIDPDAKYDRQRHMWQFRSGYKFQFGHCQRENDWEKYYSSQFTHIAFDEARQFTREQYDQISTRLRSSDPVLRPMLKVRLASNPGTCLDEKNPNWLREYFVDEAPEGRVVLKRKVKRRSGENFVRTRMYLPATLYDNPDKEFVASYEEKLLSSPAHIRQALLYGNWYATVGSFFGDDWIEAIHVVEPFKIPNDWPRFRAMDWGYKTNGTIGWFALDEDDNLYCEREFSFKEMNATEVAKRVKEIEIELGLWKGGRSKITGPADTQLWEERGESGKSKAEEFAAQGVMWRRADKRSRARNAERLLARLKDHRGQTTRPGIMFFRNCKKCITTIPTIGVDPGDSEAPKKGGEDHWLDMVMYACAYASRGQGAVGLPSEEREEDERESGGSRGRFGYGSKLF